MIKISIITPTWNSERTIERNLKSVGGQTHSSVEHIFIDNCSQDQTKAKVQSYYANRVGWIFKSEKDRGISDAFNKGIATASGEIIGILNSDDEYWDENVLSRVAEVFVQNPEVMFVHGDMFFEDKDFGSSLRRPLLCPLTYAMPYNHPTFFVRKEFYQKYGNFDVTFRFAMDFELVCRMYSSATDCTEKGKYLSDTPMVKMHAGGASYQYELKSIDEVELALKRHNFWNANADKEMGLRKLRIRLKRILEKTHLQFLVKQWRDWKWGDRT